MDRPCPNDSKNWGNHGQRDKKINRLKREHTCFRTKLVTSFNWAKINAIAPKHFWHSFHLRPKKLLWVCGWWTQ